MNYRTSVFWDILVPLLVGMSIVYFLEFIYYSMSGEGKIGAYSSGNSMGLTIEGRLWSPVFEGRKGSLPMIMKSPSVPAPDQELLTAMERHFKPYQPETSLIPTWIVTSPDVSTIHRFFDSSPFSPSGRYLGLTRVPNIFKGASGASGGKNGKKNKEKDSKDSKDSKDNRTRAEVVVIDLMTGKEKIVATTQAWGAQLGAQVQWGETDNDLLFNVDTGALAMPESPANKPIKRGVGEFKAKQKGIAGLVVNPSTGERKALDCPVYHVSSDGRRTVSPHMMKIKYTQLGYGADYARASGGKAGYTTAEDKADMITHGPHSGAPDDDGVFVGSVESGKCELVASLKDLAEIAGIDTSSTPVYGFHTKWSPDGEYIMFVLRSLEKRAGLASIFATTLSDALAAEVGGRVRRQHLFVMKRDGSDALHLLSWSSHPFKPPRGEHPQGEAHSVKGGGPQQKSRDVLMHHEQRNDIFTDHLVAALGGESVMDTYDANHPTWVPGTHIVSVNMKPNSAKSAGMRDEKGWDVAKLNIDELYQIHKEKKENTHSLSSFSSTTGKGKSKSKSKGKGKGKSKVEAVAGATLEDAEVLWKKGVAYHRGSGHPTYHPKDSARYLLLDAYAKELPWFTRWSKGKEKGRKEKEKEPYDGAPLRIVDTHAQAKGDVWALEVPLTVPNDKGELAGAPSDLSARHRTAWRCDMHPAWNTKNHRWVAFNGRPEGGNRQVMVAYIGDDPSAYFEPNPAGGNNPSGSGPTWKRFGLEQ